VNVWPPLVRSIRLQRCRRSVSLARLRRELEAQRDVIERRLAAVLEAEQARGRDAASAIIHEAYEAPLPEIGSAGRAKPNGSVERSEPELEPVASWQRPMASPVPDDPRSDAAALRPPAMSWEERASR
jgi:hypothetical protein